MAVTRCVCFRRTFTDLLAEARRAGWTSAAELSSETGCGTGCTGCRPYLEAMLATGEVCFRVRQGARDPEPCEPEPWDVPLS